MKHVLYVVGIALMFGGFTMGGNFKWVVWVAGVILTLIAHFMETTEEVGETDKTILFLLSQVAAADGDFAQTEQEYVEEYIKRRGLSQKTAASIKAKNPEKFQYPTDEKLKMRIIEEVIGLIKADGVVGDAEKDMLGKIAEKLHLDKETVISQL